MQVNPHVFRIVKQLRGLITSRRDFPIRCMAREETTPDQLENVAKQFDRLGQAVRELAAILNQNNVPNVRLHLGTLSNVLMPQLDHWLNVAKSNANDDVGNFLRGIESRSIVQKRYDEKRKLKSAKSGAKPSKKVTRATSKKTP